MLNTTGCDGGANLFWPLLLWMLGAFLLGLLIPWILRLLGGEAEDDWKSKYEGLEGKYSVLQTNHDKLQREQDEAKASDQGIDWKKKFQELESKFNSEDQQNMGFAMGSTGGDSDEWKNKYDELNSRYNSLNADHDKIKCDYKVLQEKHNAGYSTSATSGDGDAVNSELQEKYDDLDRKHRALTKDFDRLSGQLKAPDGATWQSKYEALEANGGMPLFAGFEDTGKRDDLTKIEGIGPKINQLLNDGNVFTFENLSECEVSYIRSVLDKAGPAYKVHDPGTWPKQAKLATEGKWEELEKWQDELNGGK